MVARPNLKVFHIPRSMYVTAYSVTKKAVVGCKLGLLPSCSVCCFYCSPVGRVVVLDSVVFLIRQKDKKKTLLYNLFTIKHLQIWRKWNIFDWSRTMSTCKLLLFFTIQDKLFCVTSFYMICVLIFYGLCYEVLWANKPHW